MTTVTVIIVAYGAEPWLEQCVESALASTSVTVEVVLVDNGDTSGAVDRLTGRPAVNVVRPGRNTGFAEGCNIGVAGASGEVVALVNPDVLVEPAALARLAAVAQEPQVGIATASVRLGDNPTSMNSAGNPVHYLGIAWAGGHNEPAAQHSRRTLVASASGACCALRRSVWDELGGFEPAYFAYHEDVELSLHAWQRGFDVVYVPDAVARHYYEFSRNNLKYELLERNRWVTVLTLYSRRTLLLIAPALFALELLLLAASTVQKWPGAKLAGYRWLLKNAGLIRSRRAVIQQQRIRSDRELAGLFAARLSPTNVQAMPGIAILNMMLSAYWIVVRRLL